MGWVAWGLCSPSSHGGCDNTLLRVFDLGGIDLALDMGPVGGIVTIWVTDYAFWQLTIVIGWGILNCSG